MQRRAGWIIGAVLVTRLFRPIGEDADDLTDDDLDEIKAREQRLFDEDEAYARERGYLPADPGAVEAPEPARPTLRPTLRRR